MCPCGSWGLKDGGVKRTGFSHASHYAVDLKDLLGIHGDERPPFESARVPGGLVTEAE